ncbi:hemicentin-1-like [Saccoglossus kowalevskii]|uniref:Hemicentin-1-like n=1 Tax=Saccoglossus kowalevskii TaxID=10224 RepID=A0ABM0MIS1_SACKO|nr:PREDICTED: hemicentin-1-like [Saccoglossus kowalevskii]
MCFNQRGGYECVDIPCPANYERTERAGYCVRKCPYNDVHCRRDVLEYMTLSLANGIRSHQDLIRLFTKIQDGQIHENSFYKIIQNTSRRCGCTCDCSTQVPFNIRHDRNGKGVVYTLEPLTNAKTYQMTVEATGYNDAHQIEYQTTFVIFISVSVYPY